MDGLRWRRAFSHVLDAGLDLSVAPSLDTCGLARCFYRAIAFVLLCMGCVEGTCLLPRENVDPCQLSALRLLSKHCVFVFCSCACCRQVLEEVARLNGKLDVLGLDPWQPTDEGDGVQLRSGLASDDATGTRDILLQEEIQGFR